MTNLIVKVDGLEQVQTALVKAGPTLVRAVLHDALEAGGKVFMDRAKALAPVLAQPTAHRQPGELRDAIAEVTHVDQRQQRGLARVGLKYDKTEKQGTESPAVWGLFVEFGTQHMAAHPYMRPAYDEGWPDALAAFAYEFAKDAEASLKPK